MPGEVPESHLSALDDVELRSRVATEISKLNQAALETEERLEDEIKKLEEDIEAEE